MSTEVNPEEMQLRQQMAAEAEDRRNSILDQILEQGAKDRLSRLALVRKDKARAVGDALISAATNGKLSGKVTEEYLIQMLEQLSGGNENEDRIFGGGQKKVIIQRKKYGMDDDDDDDNDDDLL